MDNLYHNFLHNYTPLFYCITITLAILFIPIAREQEQGNRHSLSFRRRQRLHPTLSYVSIIILPIFALIALFTFLSSGNTYYDYFNTRLLVFSTLFVLMSSWGIAFFIQVIQHTNMTIPSFFLFLAITVFPLTIPLFSDTKQDLQALIEGPVVSKGVVTNTDKKYSRYETIYSATIDNHKYKIRPIWYDQIQVGQEAVFAHDPSKRYAFPIQSIQATSDERTVVIALLPIWTYTFICVSIGTKKWIEAIRST